MCHVGSLLLGTFVIFRQNKAGPGAAGGLQHPPHNMLPTRRPSPRIAGKVQARSQALLAAKGQQLDQQQAELNRQRAEWLATTAQHNHAGPLPFVPRPWHLDSAMSQEGPLASPHLPMLSPRGMSPPVSQYLWRVFVASILLQHPTLSCIGSPLAKCCPPHAPQSVWPQRMCHALSNPYTCADVIGEGGAQLFSPQWGPAPPPMEGVMYGVGHPLYGTGGQ